LDEVDGTRIQGGDFDRNAAVHKVYVEGKQRVVRWIRIWLKRLGKNRVRHHIIKACFLNNLYKVERVRYTGNLN